jgi:PQQ-dependent dehydrogenase (methanol/ethanol family)
MRAWVMATVAIAVTAMTGASFAQVDKFVPVTQEMLNNPSPDDWLLYNRTYDSQRFSPLTQITKQNVGQLRMAWTRGLAPGGQEMTPLVHNGVMYVAGPDGTVQALDATNGDQIWQFKASGTERGGAPAVKGISIFEDLVFYTGPASTVYAIDARTGQLRWEAKAGQRGHTGGSLVADGKVITSGTCNRRSDCYLSAYDARTGKEAWRFYTAAGPGDPGDATWGGLAPDKRQASTWGSPGSYDPVRKLVFWGVANPGLSASTGYTRRERHEGNPNAIALSAPADLYSNSTLALDPATGKLAWYYQNLPGDDWDEDGNQERVLVRTALNPDPKFVKWINPAIKRGEVRDVTVNAPEGGGLFVLDRSTGQFLWATPFPYDTPNFYLSKIDVETGITHINEKLLVSAYPGARNTVCYWNAKSFWSMAYHPGKNSLYIPFIDNCVDMQSATPAGEGQEAKPQVRTAILRPGGDPTKSAGLAKVNIATGEIERWHLNQVPSNGAVLATASDLIFWGDVNRRFRAFDADSGKVLWEQLVGGVVTTSTITYAVNGKQYVAVLTGTTLGDDELVSGRRAPVQLTLKPSYGHNAIYVFALP